VVDSAVDPNGPTEAGRGAILQIDPATGAVVRTLQFADFLAPIGILNWPGEGLLVVDQAARFVAGGQGLVFQVDPDQNTHKIAVADLRFRLPRSATFAPSGELWIVDMLARDESKPGSPRTLFRWDPETGHVDAIASSTQYVTPLRLYAFPGPNPRLASYTIEDVNGEPLQPGDELLITARVENPGPIATLAAAYLDTIPLIASLDRVSLRAEAGIIQTTENANTVNWVVDLPPGSSYEASYRTRLRAGAPQGTALALRSHLRSREGVHRVRRVSIRLPIYFEEGCMYVADTDADPFRFGGNPGNLFKISLVNSLTTAMVVTDSTRQPVSCISLPTEPPDLLILDAVANPRHYPLPAQGCLWRWDPATSDVSVAAASPSFRQPLAAVVLSDREILILDATANPFGGASGNIRGGVFHVSMPAGEVTPFATDTVLVAPRDIVLDGQGGAFIIDQDADPGRFGMRNGAVFRLDLTQRTISLYATSADFRGPVAGAVGPDGMLYVADRDVQPYPGSSARGTIFKVDPFGNVSELGSSRTFRALSHLQFDLAGHLMVTDMDADPYRLGTAQGAVFRYDQGEFRLVVGGGSLKNPAGFFLRETLTPIDLTALEATPSEDGIRIAWQVPDASFDGFLIMRAPGADAPEDTYEVLNSSEPVPGRGPWEYSDGTVEPGETYSYKIGALLPGGGMSTFGPVVATAAVRLQFAFFPVAPNPVRDTATLRFDLPRAGGVRVRIFDPAGRRVRVLVDRVLPAGRQTIVWDGRNDDGHPLASGTFYVRLDWTGRQATRTLTLLR
jgi:sugar lactone lactonase YvrE